MVVHPTENEPSTWWDLLLEDVRVDLFNAAVHAHAVKAAMEEDDAGD